MKRNLTVRVFNSFEEENQAELERRIRSTPEERMRELAALQDRVFGPDWRTRPMVKKATWEDVDW